MFMIAPARVSLRVLACAAILTGSPALARTFTANQANLTETFAAMAPGDTVVLSPGGYGVVTLPRRTWLVPINVDARAASLTGVLLFRVSGVNWTGGTIIGTNYGVSISDSARISFSGADISGAQRGIVINDSTDVKILKNKLHHLRIDGIDVVGQRILVEGNTISDMNPIGLDHPDGIQVWSTATELTRDVTVRGNTINGNMQGIFARSPALGISNLTVTGNKVSVNYPNGIVALDARNSVLTGNTVKSVLGPKVMKANMRVEGTNNKACGNLVPDVPKTLPAQPCTG